VTDFNQPSAFRDPAPLRAPATFSPSPRRDGERVRGASEGASIAAEIAFLASYGVPPGPLLAATRAAHGGVTADQALLAEGPMREEDFYRLLARHLGAPYYRAEMKIGACDPAEAVAGGIAPLAPNAQGLRHVLAPRGRALALLLAATKRSPPAFAISSPQRLGAALRAQKGRRLAQQAAGALARSDAALSAQTDLSNGQLAFAVLLAFGALLLGLLRPHALNELCAILLFAAFAASVALRLAATAAAGAPACAPAPLDERELPVYSIIAPLYREAKVAGRLIDALDALDYPRTKLDIKIVVERDDLETLTALARMRLPSRYDVIVAPPGAPATKPRALNVALPFARGELIVIYDAEDAPAPDQLRRAAARLGEDPTIDCLQARLVIDNIDDSWLTSGITAQTPQESSPRRAQIKGHERAFQQIRPGRAPRETRRNRWRDHASRTPPSPLARNHRACRRDVASVRSERRPAQDRRQAPL